MDDPLSSPPLVPALLDWFAAFAHRSLVDFLQYARSRDLTLPQMTVLMHLYYRRSSDLTALIRMLQVTKGAASQMVERLVQMGLVERGASSQDHRSLSLNLTLQGQQLIGEAIHARQQWLGGLMERLSAQEQDDILKAIQALSRAASQDTTGKMGHPPDSNFKR